MHSEAGKGSTRRPTDEKAYGDKYQAIFGESRAKRGSYVYDKEKGELVPKEEYYSANVSNAPFVMNDIQPYKNMVDGQMITSRSTHREFLKANRLVEIGTETKAHLTKQAPKVDRESIKRDIHHAMQRLGY
jgi:hypothetical protein